MKRLYINIMMRICWTLEDIYYFFTCKAPHSSKFYPSAKYEDALIKMELDKEDNTEEAKQHIKDL